MRRGTFHCFGCGAHGDVFDYVMRRDALEFPEAVEELAERAGIELSRARSRRMGGRRTREAIGLAAACAAKALSARTQEAGKARAWLASQGILPEATRRWGIGVIDKPSRLAGELSRCGLGEEGLRGSGVAALCDGLRDPAVTVPVRGASGRTVAIAAQGRTDGWARTNVAPSRNGTCLGADRAREAIRSTGVAIVTLHPIEAVALHEAGIDNAVSTLGGGLGEGLARTLAAYGARDIALLYPDGPDGRRAAGASLVAALSADAAVRVAWLGKGEGVLQACRMGRDDLCAAARAATELIDDTIWHVADSWDTGDAGQLLSCVQETCAALSPAAGGDPVRAYLLAAKVAATHGLARPDDLVGAISAGLPVGGPAERASAGMARTGGDVVRTRVRMGTRTAPRTVGRAPAFDQRPRLRNAASPVRSGEAPGK